jgi:hypothetical protein
MQWTASVCIESIHDLIFAILQTAKAVLEQWLMMRKNVANLIANVRRKVHENLLRRYSELQFLEQLCSGDAGKVDEVRIENNRIP